MEWMNNLHYHQYQSSSSSHDNIPPIFLSLVPFLNHSSFLLSPLIVHYSSLLFYIAQFYWMCLIDCVCVTNIMVGHWCVLIHYVWISNSINYKIDFISIQISLYHCACWISRDVIMYCYVIHSELKEREIIFMDKRN